MKYQIIGVVAGYLSWTILFLGGAAGVRRILSSTHDEKGFSQDPFTLLIYLGISLFASLAAAGITTYFQLAPLNLRAATTMSLRLICPTKIPSFITGKRLLLWRSKTPAASKMVISWGMVSTFLVINRSTLLSKMGWLKYRLCRTKRLAKGWFSTRILLWRKPCLLLN